MSRVPHSAVLGFAVPFLLGGQTQFIDFVDDVLAIGDHFDTAFDQTRRFAAVVGADQQRPKTEDITESALFGSHDGDTLEGQACWIGWQPERQPGIDDKPLVGDDEERVGPATPPYQVHGAAQSEPYQKQHVSCCRYLIAPYIGVQDDPADSSDYRGHKKPCLRKPVEPPHDM